MDYDALRACLKWFTDEVSGFCFRDNPTSEQALEKRQKETAPKKMDKMEKSPPAAFMIIQVRSIMT